MHVHLLIITPSTSNCEMFLKIDKLVLFFSQIFCITSHRFRTLIKAIFLIMLKIPRTSKKKKYSLIETGGFFLKFKLHIHWHHFFVNIIKRKYRLFLLQRTLYRAVVFTLECRLDLVILVLFVILLSKKNRIMRNLCTSMYNFIMFVYLFFFWVFLFCFF